jgi:hypothetical protein
VKTTAAVPEGCNSDLVFPGILLVTLYHVDAVAAICSQLSLTFLLCDYFKELRHHMEGFTCSSIQVLLS